MDWSRGFSLDIPDRTRCPALVLAHLLLLDHFVCQRPDPLCLPGTHRIPGLGRDARHGRVPLSARLYCHPTPTGEVVRLCRCGGPFPVRDELNLFRRRASRFTVPVGLPGSHHPGSISASVPWSGVCDAALPLMGHRSHHQENTGLWSAYIPSGPYLCGPHCEPAISHPCSHKTGRG